MTVLGPIVKPSSHLTPVFDTKNLHRSGIGFQPIRDNCGRTTMPLQRLLEEPQSRRFIPLLRDVALEYFTFMIDGTP